MRLRGFTLIELVLVLVVLSIVLALSFPDLKKAYSGFEVRQASDTVVYFMRYARSRAIAQGLELEMVMATDGFQLMQGAAPLSGRMGRPIRFPSGVQWHAAPAKIVFGPDGRMDQVAFGVIRGDREFMISTKEMPGHVVLLEDAQE